MQILSPRQEAIRQTTIELAFEDFKKGGWKEALLRKHPMPDIIIRSGQSLPGKAVSGIFQRIVDYSVGYASGVLSGYTEILQRTY